METAARNTGNRRKSSKLFKCRPWKLQASQTQASPEPAYAWHSTSLSSAETPKAAGAHGSLQDLIMMCAEAGNCHVEAACSLAD
jgi:hypothetical protein